MKKVILCIGTLDSKGPELEYVKQLINSRDGFSALVMDTGSLEASGFSADITAAAVAEAAGSSIDAVRAIKEAGPAANVMTAGALKLACDLLERGKFHAILSVGGGMGSSIASAVMREMPIGMPKLMVCSQKLVQAGIRKYVGTTDIVVMPSVADIAGLNRLTRNVLGRSVGAITGMLDVASQSVPDRPLVFMTMTGLSTGCGLTVKDTLESQGFEVAVFHAIGVGGETFEQMVKTYPVEGVIEMGLNEIGNELFGGLASAGPKRLEAAGEKGIPQIVTPGCVDFINFLGPETLPERFRSRQICYHNPQATLPRLNSDESQLVAKTIAGKLNRASGKVKFLVPTRGFSSPDAPGNVFYEPDADKAFVQSMKDYLKPDIEILEFDAHINDSAFAEAVTQEFLSIVQNYGKGLPAK